MADPAQTLTFLSWVRERVSGLGTAQAGGRAQAATTVTLTATTADGTVTGSPPPAGPIPACRAGRRRSACSRGAIVRRYPAPGTLDHESDRCPYVELADPSLPWRYTPAATPAASSANLHPWLVLVVGEEGTELTLAHGRVTVEASAQGCEHALGIPSAAHRFAHVQWTVPVTAQPGCCPAGSCNPAPATWQWSSPPTTSPAPDRGRALGQ